MARAAQEKTRGNCIQLCMTVLLQALAGMEMNKGVGKDGVPVEALKALDWHSKLRVLQCFIKRLNGEEGFDEIVVDWMNLVAQFIPKSNVSLTERSSWRAVLVGCSLQKWYLSSLLLIAQDYYNRIPSYVMGFRRGYQTAMLIEPLRIALLLAHEWHLPIAVAGADADSAFESLPHVSLIGCWELLGAPCLLIAALYREMAEAKAEIVICGQSSSHGCEAHLRGGGRPGDVATPAHWNVVVNFILHRLVPSWVARGLGFRFGDALLLVLCWADDFTLVASSIPQLRTMLVELAKEMYEHGIQFKESKCNWFANTAAWEKLDTSTFSMRVDIDAKLGAKVGWSSPISHVGVHFKPVLSLEVLGACLTPEADAEKSITFALSRGHGHWIMQRKQLCRRRVKLSARIQRYYKTVGLTVLHGLEGVPLTQALLQKVIAFDRRNLKAMAGLRKHIDEDWVAFHQRRSRFLRGFMGRAGIMELAARLIAKQQGWAGHMARLPADHIAAGWCRAGTLADWHLKQTMFSYFDPLNTGAWRHKTRGKKVHWEANLCKVFGDQWRSQALERKSWRSMRSTYVLKICDELLGSGSKPLGVRGATAEVNLSRGGEVVQNPVRMVSASEENSEIVLSAEGIHSSLFNGNVDPDQHLLRDGVEICSKNVPGVERFRTSHHRSGTAPISPPPVWRGKLQDAYLNRFAVERGVAASALKRFSMGLQLQIIGDSRVLIDCLLGRACAKQPEIRRHVQLAHIALQTLVQHFCVKSPGAEEIARQLPRSENTAADAAANRALDQGTFNELRLHEAELFLKQLALDEHGNVGLLFSFDGAARGNPGPSSSGVCAWWGLFNDSNFYAKGLLMQRGASLGIATNNRAEAHGLATALKACLHYHYWLIEQISQLARHAVRDE